MNRRNQKNRNRLLGPALLVAAALTLPGAAQAAGDPSVVHADGYLNSQGRGCMTLREHDGKLYNLVGAIGGLQTGDHVRVEGRFVEGSGCGAGTGVNVTGVQAIWADDNHRTTYYDQVQNGSFEQWAVANRGYNPRSNQGRDGRDSRDHGNYDHHDHNGGSDRNDHYDRSDRSQDLRRVSGRVQGYRGDCLIVRGDDGHYYGLTGDVGGNDSRGDRVRVLGFIGRGVCGSRTVEVQEVR